MGIIGPPSKSPRNRSRLKALHQDRLRSIAEAKKLAEGRKRKEATTRLHTVNAEVHATSCLDDDDLFEDDDLEPEALAWLLEVLHDVPLSLMEALRKHGVKSLQDILHPKLLTEDDLIAAGCKPLIARKIKHHTQQQGVPPIRGALHIREVRRTREALRPRPQRRRAADPTRPRARSRPWSTFQIALRLQRSRILWT
jgi:predicted transcriptional regulator